MNQTVSSSEPLEIVKTWLLRLFGETPAIRSRLGDLDSLAPAELDRIARDLGLSATDLLSGSHGDPKNVELLMKMLDALGLDPEVLAREGTVLRDMERLCGMCKSTGQCRSDLESGDAAEYFTDYCMNKTTLEQLLASKAAAAQP